MTFTKQPKVGADEIDDISMSLDQTIVAERRIYQGAPTIFVNDKAIHGGMVVFRNTSLVQYPDKELVEWQKPSLRITIISRNYYYAVRIDPFRLD